MSGEKWYYYIYHESLLVLAYFPSATTKTALRSVFAPKIDVSDTIAVNSMAMLQGGTDLGFIFVGQVT